MQVYPDGLAISAINLYYSSEQYGSASLTHGLGYTITDVVTIEDGVDYRKIAVQSCTLKGIPCMACRCVETDMNEIGLPICK